MSSMGRWFKKPTSTCSLRASATEGRCSISLMLGKGRSRRIVRFVVSQQPENLSGLAKQSQKTLNFFIHNQQCKLVILGVCHDNGYLPVLNELASDVASRDRITLLQQGALNPKMRQLGFTRPTLQLDSVFSPLVKSMQSKATVSADARLSAAPRSAIGCRGLERERCCPCQHHSWDSKKARSVDGETFTKIRC